jgi:hypothetical protein
VRAVLGQFHWLLSDLDPKRMNDPLPGFHITPDYLAKYDATLLAMPKAKERLNASMEARRMAMFIEERRGFAATLQRALQSGELTLRMMHGDPKVNNIMIDDSGTWHGDVTGIGVPAPDHSTSERSALDLQPRGRGERISAKWCSTSISARVCKGYMAHLGAFGQFQTAGTCTIRSA